MVKAVTPFFDEAEAKKILRSRVLKEPSRRVPGARPMIFVDDMTDLFGDWVPDSIIDWHFALFALRQDVTFQVLTKRPERAQKYFAGLQRAADEHAPNTVEGKFSPAQVLNIRAIAAALNLPGGMFGQAISPSCAWPLPNVHLGVSVENQKAADERIPVLLQMPAAVRFLSCEPLLSDLQLWAINDGSWYDREGAHLYDCLEGAAFYRSGEHGLSGGPTIDWVIVGGESGHGARPYGVQWARSIIEQCKAAGVACFHKQVGGKPYEMASDGHAVRSWGEAEVRPNGEFVQVHLKDKKGGSMSEWPADLRVREFPKAAAV